MFNRKLWTVHLLVFTLIMGAEAPSDPNSSYSHPVENASQAGVDVTVCRTRIYSAIGPAHLISPEGIRVIVPMKDAEAARARGFKTDYAAVIEQAQEYGNNPKQSDEQAILAKLSDEQLTALFTDVATCTSKHRDALSRDDLIYYGIAMAEIASARQYRAIGHLLVASDEERVSQYNALAAKYNALLAKCSR
jgi:hypothetical protein